MKMMILQMYGLYKQAVQFTWGYGKTAINWMDIVAVAIVGNRVNSL